MGEQVPDELGHITDQGRAADATGLSLALEQTLKSISSVP